MGAASFFILEAGVRIFVPQPPSWLDVFRQHPRLPFFALRPNAHALVDTGETRWEIWTDEEGRRVAKNARKPRLPAAVWIGDSFTFGHGVDFEQTWIGRLAARPDARFRHENLGVGAYGPPQYRAVLEDLLHTGTQVAHVFVVTFLGNDFHDTLVSKDIPTHNGVLGDDGSWKSWMKRNFHAYRLAARIRHRLASQKLPEEGAVADLGDPKRWLQSPLIEAQQQYRDDFAAIAQMCAARSIALTVVVIPTASMVTRTKELGVATAAETSDERGMIPRAMGILRQLGIEVVDTTVALAEQEPADLYFRFDQHFTPKGHAVVEELLRSTIPDLGN